MEIAVAIVTLIASFFCVYYGATFFIDGAVAIARKFKVPAIVIALTIVAFGTSVPELVVAITSWLKGTPMLSLGDLLGSSFADMTLVLGVAALIRPIHIKMDFLRKEFPFVIVTGVLLLLLATDGVLTWGDGVILILVFAVYLYYTLIVEFLESKMKPAEEKLEEKELKTLKIFEKETPKVTFFYLFGGLAALILGAHWLTESAIAIAKAVKVPELVIGITVIGIGTVMPEFITGIMASIKGDEDVEVGNALGSFIFNSLFILGILVCLQPLQIGVNLLFFELPIMLAVGILLIPLMRRNFILGRFEGALLVLIYALYISKQIFF